MKNRLKPIFPILILMISALLVTSCGEEELQEEQIIRPVRYQTVYATGGERIRTFSSVSRAALESRLSFKVAGTVEEVAVKVGDQVESGDLIARIDPVDYRLRVQEAEASLEQARAQARNAAANYDRVRSLYENNNASLNDLDAARAADESARATVRSIEKKLEQARRQLTYTRLTAPVQGAIAAVMVEENENVRVGQAVALLTSGSELEVETNIPEVLISDINEGDPATVTFDAFPEKEFEATISEVGVTSIGQGSTYPVTALLKEQDPALRPGMAGKISIRFKSGDGRERIIVPSVAVGEDRQGRFVFTVEPADSGLGIVHRRQVTVGELTNQGLQVLEGLREGDLLITAGVSRIIDSQKVKLPQPEGVYK